MSQPSQGKTHGHGAVGSQHIVYMPAKKSQSSNSDDKTLTYHQSQNMAFPYDIPVPAVETGLQPECLDTDWHHK